MKPNVAVRLLTVIGSLLAIGCSDGGTGDDEVAIRRVIQQFADALNEGSAGDAYALLDSGSKKSCKLSDFEGAVLFAKSLLGSQKFELSVDNVQINRYQATADTTARVAGGVTERDTTNLVKEEGRWKISIGPEECGFGGDSGPTPSPVPSLTLSQSTRV